MVDKVPAEKVPDSNHLWIVNHYSHLPSEVSGLTRHYDFSKHLKELGWNVTIIAASTRHPFGTNRFSSLGRTKIEDINGIKQVWIPTTPYRANGTDRIVNMILFWLRIQISMRLKKLPRPDIIIGSSPHPLSAHAASLIARRYKVPFIFEIRDLWPEALIAMGRLKRDGLLAKALFKLERNLVKHSSMVVSLWEHVDSYIKENVLPEQAYRWISNGFDKKRFAIAEYKNEKGTPFTFMYFGAHGGANDLQNAIKAMAEIKKRGGTETILLRLIGHGPEKKQTMELAKALKLKNVVFENSIPKSQIPSLAQEADVMLFTLKNLPLFQYGISPNKLFEYMASKRPVLFCCNAENNPVARSGGGVCVPPGDPVALADVMILLSRKSKTKLCSMAENGFVFISQKFELGELASQYNEVLLGTLSGKN